MGILNLGKEHVNLFNNLSAGASTGEGTKIYLFLVPSPLCSLILNLPTSR